MTTLPDTERPEHQTDDGRWTMRSRVEIAINLQARLEANREGRAVLIQAADFYDWPGGNVAEHVEHSLPQWLVAVILEWCTIEPQPAMTIEEWVAAMGGTEVLDGPYALWGMLEKVDAKADALAHMIHEFGGAR